MAAAAESAQAAAAAAAASTAAAAAAAAAAKDPKVRRSRASKKIKRYFRRAKGEVDDDIIDFPQICTSGEGTRELDINIPDVVLFLHTGSTL